MIERAVVLLKFRQADQESKARPGVVLCIMPGTGDMLVCGVSTQLHMEVAHFDDTILPGDADFTASGLKAASLIRLGFLLVVARRDILGRIGNISEERHQRLVRRLADYLVAKNA